MSRYIRKPVKLPNHPRWHARYKVLFATRKSAAMAVKQTWREFMQANLEERNTADVK